MCVQASGKVLAEMLPRGHGMPGLLREAAHTHPGWKQGDAREKAGPRERSELLTLSSSAVHEPMDDYWSPVLKHPTVTKGGM